MTTTTQLLALVHDIAEPCEAIRERCGVVALDPSVSPEMKQASQDLSEAIERMFQIASYIMAHTPRRH